MALHFSKQEYLQRIQRAQDALNHRKLDGVLLFAPESHYYLTGYDTFGFAMFQCMVLSARGDVHLFTRLPDLRPGSANLNPARQPDSCLAGV